MRYLALLAFTVLASSASASTFNVSCGSYYPEPEDPWNSSIVAEAKRDPMTGEFIGLVCREVEGDPVTACATVFDGACCPCNMARGFTPECEVVLEYTDASTVGRCNIVYPLCYYGNQCDSTSGSFIDPTSPRIEARAIVKRSKTKHGKKPRKLRKAKQAHGCVSAF
jgi:hypothetical protein